MIGFLALMRREYWEHRWAMFYLPLVLLGALVIGTLGLVLNADQMVRVVGGVMVPTIVAQVFGGIAAIVWGAYLLGSMFFYSADAFTADKRNNSMLFWKSLPQSDFKIVLSKFLSALVLLPIIVLAFFLVTCAWSYLALVIGNVTMGMPAPPLAPTAAGLVQVIQLAAMIIALAVLWYMPFMALVAGLSTVVGRWSIPIALLAPAIIAALEYALLRSTYLYQLIDARRTFDFGIDYVLASLEQQRAFDPNALAQVILGKIDWLAMAEGWVFALIVLFLAGQWRRRSVLG